MDAAPSTGPPVRLGISGDDTPVFAPIHTADVDEARTYYRNVSYGTTQLLPQAEVERFAFDCNLVQLGPFTVGEISYGAAVRLIAPDLGDVYHVLMNVGGVMESRHRGRQVLVAGRRAGVYGPVGDIRMDWQAGARMFSVRIDRAALDEEIAAVRGLPPATDPAVGDSFAVAHGRGRNWAAFARLFYAELRKPDSVLHNPQLAQRWWRLALSGLALAVDAPAGDERYRYKLGLRPRPVKRALDAIHANPGATFTVTDLAYISGVSARLLQEAFQRHVGIPPMRYLRELRLSLAHEELARSDPWQMTVGEIAFRWGFTHLGRFAGAYRQRYGVPPSQTLRDRP